MHEQRVGVGAGGADLMEDILAAVAKSALLLTGLTSEDVIRTATIAGFSAIVFVRGKRPDTTVLELAKTYQMPCLMSAYSLFVASGRLYVNGLRGLHGSW